VGVRGVRVVTPTSSVFRVPSLARLFTLAERTACDLQVARHLAGFLILIARKR